MSLILLAITITLICQLIRVRIFNLLAEPYFRLGIRTSVFANGVCLVINTLIPFRFGDLGRFVIIHQRINANKANIIASLLQERIIDIASITLISIIMIKQNIISKPLLPKELLLLIFIPIALSLQKSLLSRNSKIKNLDSDFSKYLIILNSNLKNINLKNLSLAFGLDLIVWSLYFLVAQLLTRGLGLGDVNWTDWYTKIYRLTTFDSNGNKFGLAFFILFVGPVIIFGITLALFKSSSNRLLMWTRGGGSDEAFSGDFRYEIFSAPIAKKLFPSKKSLITSDILGRSTNAVMLHGGSGAIVIAIVNEGEARTVYKGADGTQMAKLYEQYRFIQAHEKEIPFPKVLQCEARKEFFSYEMEFLSDYTDCYSKLALNNFEGTQAQELLLDLGQTISTFKFHRADVDNNFHKFWELKLMGNLEKIRILAPEFPLAIDLVVNTKALKNLSFVVSGLKEFAFSTFANREPTLIHGDTTLSNSFYRSKDRELKFIDPNPETLFSVEEMDHGKVLQSLHGRYEQILNFGKLSRLTENEIDYVVPNSDVLSSAKDFYCSNLPLGIESLNCEYFTFVSMLRLLPYQIAFNRRQSVMLFARTVEIGNRLLEEIS
jgi:hypothetical protein